MIDKSIGFSKFSHNKFYHRAKGIYNIQTNKIHPFLPHIWTNSIESNINIEKIDLTVP